MGFLDFLKRPGAQGTAEVDNRSEDDNWIVNKSDRSVTVACEEMFGSFTVHLSDGEKKVGRSHRQRQSRHGETWRIAPASSSDLMA